MPTFKCPVCDRRIGESDVEQHISESHSDPEPRTRTVAGAQQEITDAEYVRAVAGGAADVEPDEDFVDLTVAPIPTVFDHLGIKADDFSGLEATTETGGALTAREAKKVLAAMDTLAGFSINRAQFIVDLLDWGFRNAFSEELQDAGGFDLVQNPTVGSARKFVRVTTIHSHVTEHLTSGGSARSFTFRRFGRYLGADIVKIVDSNEHLRNYYRTGTPISNRLGVRAVLFLTTTSIYEYIKPYNKWTKDERDAWGAMNRSAVKVSNAGVGEFMPQDLRPSPTQASTAHTLHLNDFGMRQHERASDVSADYGKGQEMFERMWRSGQQGHEGVGYTK